MAEGTRFGDWLFPFWLERQLDPTATEYVPAPSVAPAGSSSGRRAWPGGLLSDPVNVTHRNWTLIGNLGSWHRPTVDPRGLVTPREGGWSLDWWVRSEERWHLPAREAAVRQRLLDGTPVVETAMRVPGGDVLHRAYAVRPSSDECAVVEIENASAVPIAVALAVRPFHVTGAAQVGQIGLDDSNLVVSVDGEPAVVFPKVPAQLAFSSGAAGDCVAAVMAEATNAPGATNEVTCPDGWAQAAFVFPMAHTTTLRVALPLATPPSNRRAPRPPVVRAVQVADLPDGVRVASGWRVHGERGARFDLPDGRLQEAMAAARTRLLLVHGGEDIVTVPDRGFDYSEAAAVLDALDVLGYADEVEQVLATWPERQASDGWFTGIDGRGDANGAALHALGSHWRTARNLDKSDELALLVARAAHAIDKRRSGSRRRGAGGPRGMLPAGLGPAAGGPAGSWIRDAVWSLQGLRDAVDLLEVLAQPEAAAEIRSLADRFDADVRAVLADRADAVWPATVGHPLDAGIVANLDAVNLPLTWRSVGGRDPLPGRAVTLDAIREHLLVDGGVHQAMGPVGLSARYTAMLARAELPAGDHRPERSAWLLANASPTWAWPEAQHPTRGAGSFGAGDDGVALAWFVRAARDALVRETADGLALCTDFPFAWLGLGVEVHDAPTAFGQVSFAVRWHGERPALLWDTTPHDDQPGPFTFTAPGLDPSWSTTEPKGEALLAVPPHAVAKKIDPAALEGESFA